MNPEELNQFREDRKDFLKWLGGKALQLEDAPLSLKADFEKLLTAIQRMELKDFSIPGLIMIVDQLIVQCDCLKNQLIELKSEIKLHRSHIYRSHNKEN
jgi:hypothetical protein